MKKIRKLVSEEVFNDIRNLEGHILNLAELEKEKVVAGVCALCAASYCKFNTTLKNVLDKNGELLDKEGDGYNDILDIAQYICDDEVDDIDILSRDLRGYTIEEIEE